MNPTHPATFAVGQTWQVPAAEGEPPNSSRTIVAINDNAVTFTSSDYPGKPITFSLGAFARWAARASCVKS